MSRRNAGFALFGEHAPGIGWVVAGLVGVPPAIKNGLHVSALVYGIFFVMVLAGFWKWLQEARSTTPSADKAAVTI